MPEHFVLVDRDEVVEGSSGSAEASDEEATEAGHGHDVVALLQNFKSLFTLVLFVSCKETTL